MTIMAIIIGVHEFRVGKEMKLSGCFYIIDTLIQVEDVIQVRGRKYDKKTDIYDKGRLIAEVLQSRIDIVYYI